MGRWLFARTTPFADGIEDNQVPQQQERPEIAPPERPEMVPPPGKQGQQFSWSVLHWVALVEFVVIVILVILLFFHV
jgi:hypothetical protein